MAWQTANLTRAKKLPALSKLLPRRSLPAPTAEEVEATVEAARALQAQLNEEATQPQTAN